NPRLDMFRERPQMEIAGPDFDPGVGDADQRLLQVGVRKSGTLEHRARRCAARSGRERVVSVSGHACISKESGRAFVAEAGLQLEYEPSTRTIGANSAR